MEFTIRPAEVPDALAVAEVHVAGWQWGYRDVLPADLLSNLDATERAERLLAILADPERTASVRLAESEGAVVGFVSSGPTRDPDAPEVISGGGGTGGAGATGADGPGGAGGTGEVYALYVAEAAAGTGVGPALLGTAVADLGDRGFRHATLWVLDSNARARRFYEREGWRPDGATKSENFRGHVLSEVRSERTPDD